MSDVRAPWLDATLLPARTRSGWRRALATGGLIVLVVFVVSMLTGAPGPGILRRYPVADLHALADDVNAGTGSCRARVG